MEYDNAAERAAKLRAAERAAAEEKAKEKARKTAVRKKKSRARRAAFTNGMEDFFEFIADNKFSIINVLFILANITLCVLMCLGLANVSDLFRHIAKICFFIGIGTLIISVIMGIVALNDDDDGFEFASAIALFVVDFAMFVIGFIALFVVVV
ncbi:MAG: hypothetical protein NC033_02245 [Clostridiales bacterium]|nr:hypothetical protein [Clostridiales bacterium]